MSNTSPSYLVVGGGIAGLLSARILAESGARVTLVERNNELGGLLASRTFGREDWVFDYGTHVPDKLHIPELDRLLFGEIRPEEWHHLPALRSGTYAFGQLSSISPYINLHSLGQELHDAITAELLSFKHEVPRSDDSANMEQFVTTHYGPLMAKHVLAPITRKLYGKELAELSPGAFRTFAFERYIAFDEDKAAELKKEPALDARLAYHNFKGGSQNRMAYYPKTGGMGQWVRLLTEELKKLGVRILTGETVTALSADGDTGRRLTSATLQSGEKVEFQHLVWTLAPALLLRSSKHSEAATLVAPPYSRLSLYHFVQDKPVISDLPFITVYDGSLHSFRATLYDNLQPGAAAHRVTVEVLLPVSGVPAPEIEAVFPELATIGIASADTRMVAAFREDLPVAFPIATPDFERQSRLALSMVEEAYDNVSLFGRGAGAFYFMNDVNYDVYTKLQLVLERSEAAAALATR